MFLKNLSALFFPLIIAVPLSLILNYFTPLVSKNWHYSLVFLSLLCFILNLIYARYSASKTFTQLLLAGIVIKLLAGFTVVLVYSLIDRPGFLSFSIHFIGHYILFTIFEIRYLLFLIKHTTR